MEILLPLSLFALVSSVSPGPNNLMLMSSGATFGMRRTIPHMLGVSLGFTFMVLLVGIGITALFDRYPLSYTILQWFSVLYLSYLAVRIARSAAPDASGKENAKPLTFLQAASFQWVNPKAWSMALTAISLYAPEKDVLSVLLVAVVFGAVNFPSITLWATIGHKLQGILSDPNRLRLFNFTMAGLLIAFLYPILMN